MTYDRVLNINRRNGLPATKKANCTLLRAWQGITVPGLC